MSAWLLLLGACGGKYPEAADYVVDCEGLRMPIATGPFVLADAPIQSVVPGFDHPLPRCSFLGAVPWTRAEMPIHFGDIDFPPNTGLLVIAGSGARWISESGTLRWDRFEPDPDCVTLAELAGNDPAVQCPPNLAIGRYEVSALPEAPDGTRGSERKAISGSISLCDYGNRPDCPYAADLGGLSKRASVFSHNLWGVQDAAVLECRMLHDRATGAFRVDLQLAEFRGVNVGQLFVPECGVSGADAAPNAFRFQAAGVDGPGEYGPTQALLAAGAPPPTPSGDGRGNGCGPTDADPPSLPWMCWEYPLTFWPSLVPPAACSAFGHSAFVRTSAESVCGFVWTEDPGHITLNCTRAATDVPDSWVLGAGPPPPWYSDFWLSVDCDYVPAP